MSTYVSCLIKDYHSSFFPIAHEFTGVYKKHWLEVFIKDIFASFDWLQYPG